MSIHEKRTIIELSARYQLEPDLKDIYVEGELDKGVFDWSVAQEGRGVTVYEISSVAIPPEEVLERGLQDNNRGRVIALANILGFYLPHNSTQVTCIADTDLDTILGIVHRHDFLLLTDYTCLEMYLYNPQTIQKFLQVAIHNFPKSAEVVLQELTSVLEYLFLARLSNETLRLGLSAISFTRYCSINGGTLQFDFNEYVKNYLTSNGKRGELDNFTREIERHRANLTADPRLQINGHDFIQLLSWYIGRHRPALRQVFDSKTLERTLFSSIEHQQLTAEGLFRRLLARLES